MAERRVLVAVGARPEVVKLAPVIRALRARDGITTVVCATGQQGRVPEWLEERGLKADVECRAVELPDLYRSAAALVYRMGREFAGGGLDLVLVQGDTTTTLAAALAAFYAGVPVGHVEAGLRTTNPAEPFPEEMNRRLVTQLATLHFAPTQRALDHVHRERPDVAQRGRVWLTGNPVVDELRRQVAEPGWPPPAPPRPYVLVTCHRREAWAERLGLLVQAVAECAQSAPWLDVLWPTHPNPRVAGPVRLALAGTYANVLVREPPPYAEFLGWVYHAVAVVTDSGGVVEEAATLGRPTLIVRDETERPEAVEAGWAEVVGLGQMRDLAARIRAAASRRRSPGPSSYDTFGDGLAGERIASLVERWLSLPDGWR